jgi:hypothetical protein
VDPLLAATEQAYAYASGSPLNATDPSGRFVWIIVAVAVSCPECVMVASAAGIALIADLWAQTHPQQYQQFCHQVEQAVSEDQRALRDLVNEVTNDGRKTLSKDDAETILDWADEVGYPGARAKPGDVARPSNWKNHPDRPPHIHIPNAGRGGHVPVDPGVRPR